MIQEARAITDLKKESSLTPCTQSPADEISIYINPLELVKGKSSYIILNVIVLLFHEFHDFFVQRNNS